MQATKRWYFIYNLSKKEKFIVFDITVRINRKENIDSWITLNKYFTIVKLFQNFKEGIFVFYFLLFTPEQRRNRSNAQKPHQPLAMHLEERRSHLASQRSTEMTEKAFEKCLGIVGKFYDRSCKPPARSAWRHLSRMFAKYPANPLNL